MEWYTWVFSGVGVAALGWLIALFYRKRNSKNTNFIGKNANVEGDDNISIQNSKDSNIKIFK